MENAEEILQCLDEYAKLKPKDIPRILEEYLCFVAKTGDPVYQWSLIKCLFREKLLNVITEFYETCPSIEIPPCPNVDPFNYDCMKKFILEKLDTFAAAPFTVQRICELLTAPRKEYNRIDKYMRALEKNILVVSTCEPGNRKSTENGESVVNGLETSEHMQSEIIHSDINVEVEMDDNTASVWTKTEHETVSYVNETGMVMDTTSEEVQGTYVSESESESKTSETATCSSSIETVITSRTVSYIGYTPNITDLIASEPTSVDNPEPIFSLGTESEAEPSLAHMDLLVGKLEVPEEVAEVPESTQPEPELELEPEPEPEPELEPQPQPESSAVYETEPVTTLPTETDITSTDEICMDSTSDDFRIVEEQTSSETEFIVTQTEPVEETTTGLVEPEPIVQETVEGGQVDEAPQPEADAS